MDYNEIKKYLSAPRLVRYEQACHGDRQRVLKLYQANLRLSQAFYPLLSLFEVVLRNALNEELARYFNDDDWVKNQLNGFMSHPSLNYYNTRLRRKTTNDFLKNSVKKITDKNAGISSGKIIADLNMGFWTELFEKTHYKNLKGTPIKIFSNFPPGMGRNQINQKLNRIRNFRNRIYHNEPVIFVNNTTGTTAFNLELSSQIYRDIKEIFSWLNLDFHTWTRKINNVEFEIQRAQFVFENYPRKKYYYKRLRLGLILYYQRYLKGGESDKD